MSSDLGIYENSTTIGQIKILITSDYSTLFRHVTEIYL